MTWKELLEQGAKDSSHTTECLSSCGCRYWALDFKRRSRLEVEEMLRPINPSTHDKKRDNKFDDKSRC